MELVIIGAGGYGRVVADIAEQIGRKVIFLDDNSPLAADKTENFILYSEHEMIPAFGNNALRLEWCNKIKDAGIRLASVDHPTAYISPKATLEEGVTVLPNAVVNTEAVLGCGCIVNVGAIVDHGTILEAGVHVAPGAIVKAENRIPALMKIESGTVIENRQYPIKE